MTSRAPARDRADRRILVNSRTAMNYDMVAPVVRAMALDQRVQFALTASEQPRRVRAIYAGAPPHYPRVGRWRAAVSKWDVCLTSDFMWAVLPRGAARVQMFHGVAGKYGFDAPTRSWRDWHRVFFVNERRLRNAIHCGALDEHSPAIRLIGMPKVDCLVDGTLRRDEVLTAASLDPSRPTVLYAPTWSPESSLNAMGLPLIEKLRAMPVNLIIKLHDRSYDLRPAYSGGVDWRAVLDSSLRPPHALLAPGGSIAPWLAAADVLITDHSSAGFEYLLLNRPVVRIEVPALLLRARVHPDYVRLAQEVSTTAATATGVADAVEDALSDPTARSSARRRVAAELFYKPGTATIRAVAALYELLELPPPAPAAATMPERLPLVQIA